MTYTYTHDMAASLPGLRKSSLVHYVYLMPAFHTCVAQVAATADSYNDSTVIADCVQGAPKTHLAALLGYKNLINLGVCMHYRFNSTFLTRELGQ